MKIGIRQVRCVLISATMKPIGWMVLVLLVVVLWFSLRARPNRHLSKVSQSAGIERSVAPVYLGMRDLVLKTDFAKLQGASAHTPGEPIAVLMDWGVASIRPVPLPANGVADGQRPRRCPVELSPNSSSVSSFTWSRYIIRPFTY